MKKPPFVSMVVIGLAAACALLLVLPGETVTTKYLNDLFIFLDGVHRVTEGQVPNRDFHTALGPLVYYVPAIGYWLTGTMGGAMPAGMALVVVFLALVGMHVLGSRLRPAIAIPLAAYLILVAAVPINLGENIRALSFGMFYNRIGWAALGFLLLMYLPAARPSLRQAWLDALCAALLVGLMLYMKVSYAVVGVAFLVFVALFDAQQRRWPAGALGLVAVLALGVEAVWGGTAGHVADLIKAGRVSGNLGYINDVVGVFFRNLPDFLIFAFFAGFALWRGRQRFRDLLFFGFCAAAGVVLIRQNFQVTGVVSLAAGAAVAAEMIARADAAALPTRRSITAGANLLLLALLLPPTLHNALALGLHATVATARIGQPVPLQHFDRVRLAELWVGAEYPSFSRYLASLADGARALDHLGLAAERVLVLDFVTPFSAGLRLKPPQGTSTWHHWGRTENEENFLKPEQVFRDVSVVMDPKFPVEAGTAEGLRYVYAEYLAENFELSHETEDWRVYIVRPSPAETVSRSVDEDDPDLLQFYDPSATRG